MLKLSLSRRQIIESSLGILAMGKFSRLQAQSSETPHFFLHLIVTDGPDNLYLYDSRPLSFKGAGLMANYLAEDPETWQGANGNSCLRASSTDALKPYQNDFSLINGIIMTESFEGHEQCANTLLCNSPFAGTYFGAALRSPAFSLDYLRLNTLRNGGFNSEERALIASNILADKLANQAELISTSSTDESQENWLDWAFLRAASGKEGESLFSLACQNFEQGLKDSRKLANQLKETKINSKGNRDSEGYIQDCSLSTQYAIKYFQNNITNTCLIDLTQDLGFDAHGKELAKDSPETMGTLCSGLAEIFKTLKATPFDEKKGLSMFDVTTVLFSTEMTRTNRQLNQSVEETGTDHNPLGNSAIIAGKGIKPGLVIGATDLDSLAPDKSFTKPSPAHLRLDKDLLKRMAKPYDFNTDKTSKNLPDTFKLEDYISYSNIINSIYSAFSVPMKSWVSAGAGNPGSASSLKTAPVIKALLK